MIPKPGKDPTDVSSYRPISLLSIISKVLEKLLHKRINKDMHQQDWIPRHQFGFRQAHCTVQQCHRLTDIINKALENHQYCTASFLDVSHSFDKVWHPGILLKIKQTLPPGYFHLLQSYSKIDISWQNLITQFHLDTQYIQAFPKVASLAHSFIHFIHPIFQLLGKQY